MKTAIAKNYSKKAQEITGNITTSRGVRKYRTLIFKGYITLVTGLFIGLALLAHFIPYFPLDLTITLYIQHFSVSWFDILMKLVSWVGSEPQAPVIIGATVLFLYFIGLRFESIVTLLSGASATILSIILKTIVNRPRPGLDLVHVSIKLHDSGFPSGHVLLYTTFFGFLLFLSYSLIKYSWYRNLLIVAFSLFIILVGPSRIYLGAHWASDVVGAYLLGTMLLTGMIYLYNWGKTRYFVHQPVSPEIPE